ncbi:MAG: glycoside hydrolase family 65 protein, partial [Chloroflexi bacterium]|nr:glycoside hydrolase family 65 protein [Chloroflexota bacterium]
MGQREGSQQVTGPRARGRALEKALGTTSGAGWTLHQRGYDPLREHAAESRFAISNGYLGVRAARAASRGPAWISWLHSLGWASWPRTFVAGLFDTPESQPRVSVLVPAPDWLRLRLIVGGEALSVHTGELILHTRGLDFKRGLLVNEWRQKTEHGVVIRMRLLRLVSLADRAIGVQLAHFEVDRAVEVTLEPRLDATVGGLEPVRVEARLGLWRTAHQRRYLAMASSSGLTVNGDQLRPRIGGWLNRSWTWNAESGKAASFWRLVGVASGDEPDTPARAARAALDRGQRAGWQRVLAAHEAAWAERWTHSDVVVDGSEGDQVALRFALYHLISAANPENERVSIGARALTGEAYLGHVFWDTEIFALPFYTFTWPEAARTLLMYRYHTLPAARDKARRFGYRGALYAWESADTGEEVTPERIALPDGRVIHVLCGLQEQHISSDVAYAVWQYWQVTGDERFLTQAGAEIILETARFWASRVALGPDDRYHIARVIGPDEYHEGIDDNAYTNVMAQWTLERGLDVAALLRDRWPERWTELCQQIALSDAELEEWREVASRMYTGLDPETGLFEQFAGYFGLEEVDLSQFEGRGVAMDVLLGQERTRRSQVIKQADTVMLLALLSDRFPREVHDANYTYYEPRCSHGSSLSRAVHALVAARLGRLRLAAAHFRAAASIDLEDSTGSSSGGVHIATQGGLWQAAVLGFAGLTVREDGLRLDPHLPESWRALRFRVQYRGSEV